MAYQDLRRTLGLDDEETLARTGAAPGGQMAAPAGVGAPAAQAAPARGTGFVNFGDVLAANRPQAEAMASGLASDVGRRGAAVETGLGNLRAAYNRAGWAGQQVPGTLAEYGGARYGALEGQAQDVAARARALGGQGLGALLGGGAPYTSGERGMDVALARGAGGAGLRAAAGRWGGLDEALGLGGATGASALPFRDMPGLPSAPPAGQLDTEEERRRRRREQAEERPVGPRGGRY